MPVHANIEPLDWESAFFGLSCGKVVFDTAAAALTPAALDAWQVVQAKVTSDDSAQLDALTAAGFRLVDGEIDLRLSVRADVPAEAALANVRLAGPADMVAVRALAERAFTLSRFRAPWFDPIKRRLFYGTWAENAIVGSFDHCCLVIGSLDAVQGMVTLRDIGNGEVRIGLLAVDATFAGRGIGRALMAAAVGWCLQQRKSVLRVATQNGNIAALRLYIASGATIDSTAYWLYRGKNDSI
ncbi:dTDP-4-amino-4,6-dideoxy-D-galactose acyltransferase [Biostraticola tofi]|uniref:dTDP-4-amino-4,6-dideoxy-D-galactose acyltransferase n=1 Tax=Biostraticola tofi TaxID=466109 RepID=A0A4R3YR64_9GAMM|nr:dTDP-4-amino-4,6-dideoxy-D-galactose acyltransferase [Biostraticola tofi]TCV93734.1 dTDP-4-amino-4,6-dideoxy-D-galactose acyltransferase [Biostraticola tofi]